ncbi:MAG: translation initiation factor IF-6 [Candidatus Lokiarchaeota archaeon]|nr:translation initiation factor IF-6 [Candidatus Harpocratesius repetitus]
MPIKKENIFGGPNIGVYLAMNNAYFLHPPKINPKILEFVKEIRSDMVSIETFIGGGAVIGSYVAMNSFGIIVPHNIFDSELEVLRANMTHEFQISVVETDLNAFGNLILCNDHGAIISPKIGEAKDVISKALKVPVRVLGFAGSNLPGACGLANNKGVLVHPMIDEHDAEIIADTLKVEIDVSTINTGNPYLGGGAIVNDYGALFGRDSTGPEIQRLLEVLQIE